MDFLADFSFLKHRNYCSQPFVTEERTHEAFAVGVESEEGGPSAIVNYAETCSLRCARLA
jgi:hypothetical protein